MKPPATGADPERAAEIKSHKQDTAARLEKPASNVVPLSPSLRHCRFCGFWLRRGTVMEILHGNRCPKMEQHRREEARRGAFRQELGQWRRADRERLAKVIGKLPATRRKTSAPPTPRPHKAILPRLRALRAALTVSFGDG